MCRLRAQGQHHVADLMGFYFVFLFFVVVVFFFELTKGGVRVEVIAEEMEPELKCSGLAIAV